MAPFFELVSQIISSIALDECFRGV